MTPEINGDDIHVSEDFLVNPSDDHGMSRINCRWRIAGRPAKAETVRYFHSLDLLLSVQPLYRDGTERTLPKSATGTALETLARRVCIDQSVITTKVILAPVDGPRIDGLATFTDEYVLATGEAAEMLGLPTEPLNAMKQALHKEKMRKVVNNTNIQAFFLQHAGKLHDPAFAATLAAIQYPLVVKPAYGRSSEGVKKVTDELGMRGAVRLLTADGLADQGILLETYVDGPELDCNFVLCDGEVLFLELTDDLPSTADASDATLADNFSETAMISHSGLPASEQEALRDSLQCSIRDLGLSWDVFHAEARMRNSSVRYDADQNLVPTTTTTNCKPTPFLIEVNIRPPVIGSSFTPLYTYGIDYNALHLLRAVEDRSRFVALSQGFRFPASAGGGGGAQYWAANCTIPMDRSEIQVPVDFMERLYARVPEIVPFVLKAELHVEAGRVPSLSGGVGFIAYVLLFSTLGREYVMEMYREVVEAGLEILDEGL
ncbi:hypothetical protein BBP40_005239 [Aspergillus hancockii]|nr:hypothetical protein BBP40_005239 [Aspergillus hancockii]